MYREPDPIAREGETTMVPAWYWPGLTIAVVAVGAVRLVRRSPLLPSRPGQSVWILSIGAGASVVLAFHCAAMFFPRPVGLISLLDGPASAIRALGTTSRLAFWIPGAIVTVAAATILRTAGAVVAVALVGVGLTMFRPATLSSHLLWIAVAVLSIAVTGLGAARVRRPVRPR